MNLPEGRMNEAALRGDILNSQQVRVAAMCVFRHDNRILVAEAYDPHKGETFYRPVGGHVEFSEWSQDALVRELREETGLGVANLRYMGVIENIFTYDGQRGHEIAFIYDGKFTDPSVYEQQVLHCQEDDGLLFRATWKRLDEFRQDAALYPAGLMEMLQSGFTHWRSL